MMRSRSTKKELYAALNQFRENESVDDTTDLVGECERHRWAKVKEIGFKTPGLKGMSYLAVNEDENNIIMLRESMPPDEMNFVCGHEIIHVKFHRDHHVKTFSCFDTIRATQNSFLEWQANEGSAELIVPMGDFLEEIKKSAPHLHEWNDFRNLKFKLSMKYNVTDSVIKYRFESLKYEIYQYLNGIPIQRIEILSRKQLAERKINVHSFNEIESNLLKKELALYNIDITA